MSNFLLTNKTQCDIVISQDRFGGDGMKDIEKIIPKEEQEEIKEFLSAVLVLSKEDRAILLANANAFRVRSDIERIRRIG